jgi:hypothetical protein
MSDIEGWRAAAEAAITFASGKHMKSTKASFAL